MTPEISLGQRIRQYRKRRHLTQTQLGKLVGLSQEAVSQLERGIIQDTTGEKIKALARVFEITTDVLFYGQQYDGNMPPAGQRVIGLASDQTGSQGR